MYDAHVIILCICVLCWVTGACALGGAFWHTELECSFGGVPISWANKKSLASQVEKNESWTRSLFKARTPMFLDKGGRSFSNTGGQYYVKIVRDAHVLIMCSRMHMPQSRWNFLAHRIGMLFWRRAHFLGEQEEPCKPSGSTWMYACNWYFMEPFNLHRNASTR